MERIRFGLIGYGAWGSHHARAITQTPGAELAAIAARSASSRAAAQAAHPQARIHEHYQDLLAKEQLDVVDVVLPSVLHYEVGRAVLESGRHLLLEKPMTLSVQACDALIELAERKRVVLAVGHECRVSPLWGKVKELVDAGAIGEPLYALIELWRRPYRQGSGGWRYDINQVGNWILEEPIHFFDLARWYLSKVGEPVSVYARANSRQSGHPELQDNFSATLNFPGGAYAVITQTLSAFEHHQTVKLTGTTGSIWASWSGALDRDDRPRYFLRLAHGEKVAELPIAKPAGELFELEEEIAMMVRAVRDGTPVAADGGDGRWAVRLCHAAQQSADTGKLVML